MKAEMIDSILRSIGLESLRNEVQENKVINENSSSRITKTGYKIRKQDIKEV